MGREGLISWWYLQGQDSLVCLREQLHKDFVHSGYTSGQPSTSHMVLYLVLCTLPTKDAAALYRCIA